MASLQDSTVSAFKANGLKPVLLAFHGSGSNATIHHVQLARIMRFLKPHFDVEILEGPFPCPAGPGILPFFDGCGPFKRWIPTSSKEEGTSISLLSPQVESLVKSTVLRLRAQGRRVLGLVGFSQGTKVVAGLLRASELRARLKLTGEHVEWCEFFFGLSVCGSYPPFLFPPGVRERLPEGVDYMEGRVQLPTFHVHGKQDEWLWAGHNLVKNHYDIGEGMSEVVEWDMGHHYPTLPEENEEIANWMIAALKKIDAGKHGR